MQSDEVKAAWKHIEYAFTDCQEALQLIEKPSPDNYKRMWKLIGEARNRALYAMDCLAIDAGHWTIPEHMKEETYKKYEIYNEAERKILYSAQQFGRDSLNLEPDA